MSNEDIWVQCTKCKEWVRPAPRDWGAATETLEQETQRLNSYVCTQCLHPKEVTNGK